MIAPSTRYGFAAPSTDFHSTLAERAAARPAGALQAQRGLAVLVPPAREDAGPVRGLEAVVGERRRRAERGQRRQVLEDAGEERLSERAQPLGPVAAGELVLAVDPQAPVDVRAVADRPGRRRAARSSRASRAARRRLG